LITARLALESNREVGVVPGPITDKGFAGTNELLQHGAAPILNSQDLLDWFGIDLQQGKSLEGRKKFNWSDNQQKVMALLDDQPIALDILVEKTDLPAPVLAAELTTLELMEVIQNVGGMRYVRKQ